METQTAAVRFTHEYFRILLGCIHERFMEKHLLSKLPKTYQLYGYGAFEEELPSLKNDFEALSMGFINGKYLYDKSRELEKGKQSVKLNEHYSNLVFLYIGFEDSQAFFDAHPLSEEEIQKQQSFIQSEDSQATYYYLNYYFGEDRNIIKGQTIISNNWKRIKHTFLYPLENGEIREHYSHGTISRQGDMLNIRTRMLTDGKYIDGASEIYYIGLKSFSNINFLVGTYCTFDIFTNTVAGRTILEKCSSKEEMMERSKSPNIPPYIAQEIRNQRLINNVGVPQSAQELSKKSPYAALYGKLPGRYCFTFIINNEIEEQLEVNLSSTDYAIRTCTENVYIEDNAIELLNKGSVVHFRFNLSGISLLEQVNVYVKSYFLRDMNKIQDGVFSGIDYENRLISGRVIVKHMPA